MTYAQQQRTVYIHLVERELAIFQREDIWQARLRLEDAYVFRSLKTRDKSKATAAAYQLLGNLKSRVEIDLPIRPSSTRKVMSDFLAARRGDLDRRSAIGDRRSAIGPKENYGETGQHKKWAIQPLRKLLDRILR